MPHGVIIFMISSLACFAVFYMFVGMYIRYSALKVYSHQGVILFLNLLNMKSRNAIYKCILNGKKTNHKMKNFQDLFEWASPYVDGEKPWPEIDSPEFFTLIGKNLFKPGKTSWSAEKFETRLDEIREDLPEDAVECFDNFIFHFFMNIYTLSFREYLYVHALIICTAIFTLNIRLLATLIVLGSKGIEAIFEKKNNIPIGAFNAIQRNIERFA